MVANNGRDGCPRGSQATLGVTLNLSMQEGNHTICEADVAMLEGPGEPMSIGQIFSSSLRLHVL